jgi:hypothetical protein
MPAPEPLKFEGFRFDAPFPGIGLVVGLSMQSMRQRVITLAPFWLPALVLGAIAIARIHARCGHAAAALDDAYIHFQYARAFAELHPFRYEAGEPLTSGSTSLLWPLALAPWWLLGLRGAKILWAAWILSFAALGGLAYEAHRITRDLAGRYAAIGAAAMVFAFSGHVWCAASGMEVVPFAWLIARTVRVCAEWAEGARTPSDRRHLVALAAVLPLLRPEGAIFSALVAATLALYPAAPTTKERARAAWALVVPLAIPLVTLLLTGSARGATAEVKLLPGNPYYVGAALVRAILSNARVLTGTLLDGEAWSAEFLPKGAATIWLLGPVAIATLGIRRGRGWRAFGAVLFAFAMFVPCTYQTFLWNRLRYLWPFMTGWLIGVACLTALIGDLLARVRPRWRVVAPVACFAMVGALAMRQDWTLDDVADSASGIDRQQVALGKWAKSELPAGARIGVNDTGAIAYFSERRTFDIVGLTTKGEGRYWVAGVGSRLEHYERLAKSSPGALPTHFIVYPEWMGCDALFGAKLQEAVVTDATILGGQVMRAYVADYSRLGTGDLPWSRTGRVGDELDVADLESEASHAYALLDAMENEQIARHGAAPDGRVVVDGGRTRRSRESFVMDRTGANRLIARVEAAAPTRVHVFVDGADIGAATLDEGDWREIEAPISPGSGRAEFAVVADEPIATFHYWLMGE